MFKINIPEQVFSLNCIIMPPCRDELADLNDWKGQQEMISDNNSAHIQRQNGDFSGLRDKVIRLHTQFELVTKGGPEALERTLAMISHASNSLPLTMENKRTDDGESYRPHFMSLVKHDCGQREERKFHVWDSDHLYQIWCYCSQDM